MIFSDPESEWNSPENRKLSADKMKEAFSILPNSLPESDQRSVSESNSASLSRKPSYAIMSDIV